MDIKLQNSSVENLCMFEEKEKEVSEFIHAQDIQAHLNTINSTTHRHLSIIDNISQQLLGHIILNDIYKSRIEFKRIVTYIRSQGIGRRAIELLKNYVRLHFTQCTSLWLDVYKNNFRAFRLYKSLGFVQIGQFENLLILEYEITD